MSEILQLVNIGLSIFLVPIFGYVISLERRIAKLEVTLELMHSNFKKRGGDS